MMIEWTLVTLLAGAPLAAWAARSLGHRVAFVAAAASAALAAAWLVAGPGAEVAWAWAPSVSIEASFVADGMAHAMLVLVLGVGAAVQAYAARYLEEGHGRAVGLLLFFEGAMAALVLAGDLYTTFAAWELTSIASYLLIGWKNSDPGARKAAQVALFITGAGGAAFLGGAVALHAATGTASWAQMGTPRGPLVDVGLGLLLVAGLTKSAQVPFQSWLPGAMKAPAFVSAYLHSATLVKAGVFLLGRLHAPFSGHPYWPLLVVVGVVTLLLGSVLALVQRDLKAMLAGTTVASLGAMVLLMGVGGTKAYQAAWLLLLAHALYKACLFLAAGSIEHGTGTRDVGRIGVRKTMPWTTAAVVLGAAGIIGVPPLLAFIAKEVWLAAVADYPVVFGASVLGVGVLVGCALVMLRGVLSRGEPHAHEVPAAMWVPPLVLGAAGLVAGVFVQPAQAWILDASGSPKQLALWHGFEPALLGTLVAYAIGAALLPVLHIGARLADLPPGVVLLSRFLDAGKRGGASIGHWMQRPSLVWQAAFAAILPTLAILWVRPPVAGPFTILGGVELMVLGLLVASAFACAAVKDRLLAAILLGASGFATALFFILVGAPDLAVTQLLYETLAVLLLLAVLARVRPELRRQRPRTMHPATRLAIAALFGAAVALPLLVLPDGPPAADVGGDILEISVPEGKGENAVNVILVDFRALDTFGEAMVLATAALATYAILRRAP